MTMMKMKKLAGLIGLSVLLTAASVGCSTTASTKESKELTIAWLPNESGADLADARTEIGKVIEEATGKKVTHKTTTDYIIAIEAVASGNADLAFLGPQGYVEAHNKNKKVVPVVVPSGPSGTLDDAVYYSWLSVKKGDEGAYKQGEAFAIDNIAGKRFSFVSNSSTSGFKVPTSNIIAVFSKQDKYKSLKTDDLLEGGKDKFFSEVLFGGSHQGSAVNLLTGKAEVAAFCDTCVANYVELSGGKANTAGASYKVKNGAAEPFNTLGGKEFVVISATPVLNSPIVANTDKVKQETIDKLVQSLTSDQIAANPKIFVPKESKFSGMFGKKTKNERFLKVEDSWFNPIRELSK